MPSDLEKAMESMIMVFHKYASKDGNRDTLSRRELKDLMENELAGFLKVCSPFFYYYSFPPLYHTPTYLYHSLILNLIYVLWFPLHVRLIVIHLLCNYNTVLICCHVNWWSL